MGSYFADNGNVPIFMADSGKIVYILADFGHKKGDGNRIINLEGQTTEMFNIIVTDIRNYSF